jgi:hypothetical protein
VTRPGSLPSLLAALLGLPACVVGAERPATPLEVARSGQAWSGGDPNDPRAGCEPPETSPKGAAPSADAVWIEGECRWDGVRYVQVDGRWETRRPEGR